MKRCVETVGFSLLFVVLVLRPLVASADATNTAGSAWAKVKDEAKRVAIMAEIKARLVDAKDIKARYIRVRYAGQVLHVAGFVPDKGASERVEAIVKQVVHGETVEYSWTETEGLVDKEPYETYVRERSSDLGIWAKVNASLAAPDVRALLRNADVQAVDVNHGRVVVFVIADAAPAEFDLAPHIQPIEGVVSCEWRVLKAFGNR